MTEDDQSIIEKIVDNTASGWGTTIMVFIILMITACSPSQDDIRQIVKEEMHQSKIQ